MSELISIIVPVYNAAEYLPRCLDSILNQQYKNIEIIAVDDGSVDNSRDILVDYSNRYPQINIVFQQNSGVTSARLRGVSEARGSWIGFVDADDYINSDMYSILYNNAQQHNADISHCGYKMLFEDGRIHYFYDSKKLIVHNTHEGIVELLNGTLIEPGLWNKLFRKELFNAIINQDILDRSIKINEDLLMNYFLFREAKKTVFHDICPYNYIVRSSSASHQALNDNRIFDPIKVRRIILDLADDTLHSVAQKAYINVCLNICNTIVIAGKGGYKSQFKACLNSLASQKAQFDLLDKKRRLMAIFITSFPNLYAVLYKLFYKYFQKKVYE